MHSPDVLTQRGFVHAITCDCISMDLLLQVFQQVNNSKRWDSVVAYEIKSITERWLPMTVKYS